MDGVVYKHSGVAVAFDHAASRCLLSIDVLCWVPYTVAHVSLRPRRPRYKIPTLRTDIVMFTRFFHVFCFDKRTERLETCCYVAKCEECAMFSFVMSVFP